MTRGPESGQQRHLRRQIRLQSHLPTRQRRQSCLASAADASASASASVSSPSRPATPSPQSRAKGSWMSSGCCLREGIEGSGNDTATRKGAGWPEPPSLSSRLENASASCSPPRHSLCCIPASVPPVAGTACGSPAALGGIKVAAAGASRRSPRPEGGTVAAVDDENPDGVGVGASEAALQSLRSGP